MASKIVRISRADNFYGHFMKIFCRLYEAIKKTKIDVKSTYFGCNISVPLDRPTNGVQMVVVKATIISTLLA